MSRRRSISTEISTDPKLARLAEHGTLAPLLYTWAIPHMDDWGRITGDPLEFRLCVCPALNVTLEQVQEALQQIADVGLWLRYTVEDKVCIAIPAEKWFRYQTYIAKGKRTDSRDSKIPAPQNTAKHQESLKIAENTAKHQETPQNTASPSPSPSPSPFLKHMCDPSDTHVLVEPKKTRKTKAKYDYTPEFEGFWAVYPRPIVKRAAFAKWNARLKDKLDDGRQVTAEMLILAARNYAGECLVQQATANKIKHPSTFLSEKHPFGDYLDAQRPRNLHPDLPLWTEDKP